MGTTRRTFSGKTKAKVAIEAIRERQTLAQIASANGCHGSQVAKWKKEAVAGLPTLFGVKNGSEADEKLISGLYEQIGRLKMELDWLKKSIAISREKRRRWLECGSEISISRQCELLGLNRSGCYYKPAGESPENLTLMNRIDELFTQAPFYGARRIAAVLRRENRVVNRKRIQRLMRLMGIEAIYPKPRLSQGDKEHRKYPYLLRGLAIVRPDQVWATDITYVRMSAGFLYLVAVIDLYSRHVLAWRLSNTLETTFCIEALEEALDLSRRRPEIFNSDQGCQFTSKDFTQVLIDAGVTISMDGRGRAFDNIFVERYWRSIKYEEIYLKDYRSVDEAYEGVGTYTSFFNNERPHEALGYRTPAEVYLS